MSEQPSEYTMSRDEGEWLIPLDKGLKAFDERLENYIEALRANASERFVTLRKRCESPIESLLYSHLVFLICGYENRLYTLPAEDDFYAPSVAVSVVPQHQVGPYRVDFCVQADISPKWVPNGRVVKLAIECDGHAFHEKTKDQAARDKTRDRFLVQHGYRVLRFTGSEIWKDAQACAEQVEAVLSDAVEEHLMAYAAFRNAREPTP
jgi:very-short-patch-repair endonuclease